MSPPDDVNLFEFRGGYLRCATCQAPAADPIPPTWLAQFTGPSIGGTVTLHLPSCTLIGHRVADAVARADARQGSL